MINRRNLVFAAPAIVAGSGLLLSTLGARAAAAPSVIRFGQSASLTGGQGRYGRDVRDGILAAFAAANADEAGKSPRFELVTLDDGGVKDRCAKNVAQLIDGGVSALIGLTSGAGAEASMAAVSSSKIALLGTASGNMGIRIGEHSAAYHVRAGYDLEYKRMTAYIKDFGMSRVGVVTLQDTSKANLDAMTQALATLSVAPLVALSVDRNATNFDDVGRQLLAARLDCVLFATNAAPIAAVIQTMRAAKYPGLFYASSFAGQDLIDTLVARKQSCIMSMVVPRPTSAGISVVNRCRQDLASVAPNATVGITTLEGYIAGRTAVQAALAATKAGGDHLSRARLRESLASLRTDLGGYRVDFASGTNEGSQYVDLIAVDRFGRLVG
jgi:branched-chain amino acid transport system substrate-binding protein